MSDDEYNKAVPVKFSHSAGFEFNDLDGMFRVATAYIQSGLMPTSIKNPQQLIVLWARAAELEIKPGAALDGMSVIGNKVGIMGDLGLSMVRSKNLLEEEPDVTYTGEQGALKCVLKIQRKGSKKIREFSFSMAQARTAKLPERNPNYYLFPERMLYYRCLGWALRDVFTDVMKGMHTTEELMDMPPEEQLMTAAQVQSEGMATVPGYQEKTRPPEAVEPAFEQDRQRFEAQDRAKAQGPALQKELERQFPAEEEKKTPTPTTSQPQSPGGAPSSQTPAISSEGNPFDDIDMSAPTDKTVPFTQPPWWANHVIKGVKSLLDRTVGSLTQEEMSKVKGRLLPYWQDNIKQASPAQLEDLKAFKERIMHDESTALNLKA